MSIACPQAQANAARCNCTYEPCPRKGNCCSCLHYHLSMNELPACAFPDGAQRTYDRSFAHFVKICKERPDLA